MKRKKGVVEWDCHCPLLAIVLQKGTTPTRICFSVAFCDATLSHFFVIYRYHSAWRGWISEYLSFKLCSSALTTFFCPHLYHPTTFIIHIFNTR